MDTEPVKNPEGTRLGRFMWCRESEFEGTDLLRLCTVTVVSGAEGRDPVDDIRIFNADLSSLMVKDLGPANPLKGHGMMHETWLAKAANGKRQAILRSPQPLEWSWAVMLREKKDFRLYLAEKAVVMEGAKGEVQLQGRVTISGNEGLSMVDLAQLTIPASTMFCQWADQMRITSMRPMMRDEVMAEIKRASAP